MLKLTILNNSVPDVGGKTAVMHWTRHADDLGKTIRKLHRRLDSSASWWRAIVIAILEEWPVICSVAVAAGAMIMVGIMLYNDWPAAQ
jgi:hypothetical protein